LSELVEPVAIIGMAGRFPGAADIGQFWNNLRSGRDCIRVPSDEELIAAGVKPEWLNSPNYVKANAEAPDFDQFDAEFFGMTPHEARLCDPQFRLFLETAHAAVEDAGYDPRHLSSVGVYGSTGRGMPQIRQDDGNGVPDMLAGTLNFADYVSILVSYKLNFTGPAMTVLSACSSSLLTVHLAVQALRTGDCDLALAGGVEVDYPPGHGYWWAPGGPYSRDGHCRPFDAAASGTVFGSGVGVVLLKRLSAAVADGDNVRAIIRGIVANNDGADKVGFSAPSVSGQTAAMVDAIGLSEVAPRDIAYVEAHGTGTTLGDPIEVAALTQAFQRLAGDDRLPTGYCGLGSVKGNVGHLSHASGITSLIKVALAIASEEIPPTINVTRPNPKLELDSSPFYLNSQLQAWPRAAGQRRLACVNSLGFGGTNVHAVLEEGPVREPAPAPAREQLIVWSARTGEALQAYESRLADQLGQYSEAGFSDAAATLQEGRTPYPVRGAVASADAAAAIAALRGESRGVIRTERQGGPRKLAFLFPGQGSQHARMARQLYAADEVFKASLDDCLSLMGDHAPALRQAWESATQDAELEHTSLAQPLLFAIEYALARMWQAFGLRPDAVIGHSVGELVAGTVAGVMELADAARLVIARAAAMSSAPTGAMLAVSAQDVPQPPDEDIVVAAVNGPRQVVFAGPADKIAHFASLLKEQEITHSMVRTSHAFHHPLMAGAAQAFAGACRDTALSAPALPFYSAAAGGQPAGGQALEPSFWSDQLIRPVLFGAALDKLLEAGDWDLLEVGPDRVLTALVQTHPDVASGRHSVFPSLPHRRSASGQDWKSVLETVAALWTGQHAIDWAGVRQGEPARRVSLPGYPYQRSRYWHGDPEPRRAGKQVTANAGTNAAAGVAVTALAEAARDGQADDVQVPPFTATTWIERIRPAAEPAAEGLTAVALLPGEPAASLPLVRALQQAGLRVIPVWPGEEYRDEGAVFHVRVAEPGDIRRVFHALAERAESPELLVHAWSAGRWEPATTGTVESQLDESFHSLISLIQAGLRQLDGRRPVPRLTVITSQTSDVSGGEELSPAKATMLGLIRTLTLEDPRMPSRLIDLGPAVPEDELIAELRLSAEPGVVALRGSRRWIPAERSIDPAAVADARPRRNGVYLITGGLGGIGLEVAKGLTQTGLSPRLVLVGRTVPPAEPASARGTRISSELDGMRALGAQVRVFAADVTDQRAMRRVLDSVTATFGPVNGVLHLAGVPGGGLLQFSAREDAREILKPKVHGTLALEELFADRPPLDFFVSFASRSGLDGDAGGGVYAAANTFLDAYPHASRIADGRVLSIDWPAWNTVGMIARETSEPAPAAQRVWTTTLSPDSPVLDDHRIAESDSALLPGAAFLDLALRAFRSEVSPDDDIPTRLEDVAFRTPLPVTEPCKVRVVLEPDGDRWHFTVQSAPELAKSSGTPVWTTHATGRVADAAGSVPSQVDVGALREQMVREEPIPPRSGSGRFLRLGPRYDNIESVRASADGTQKLVAISLPEAFRSDLDVYLLHPPQLDSATSLARDFNEPFHLPYVYSSLQVYRPLPARFLSHIRRRPSPNGLIVADMDLFGPEGELIAAITGFTMRVLNTAAFGADDRERPAGEAAPRADAGAQEAPAGTSRGLAPRTGVQLLLRLLQSRTPRQVNILPYREGRPTLLPGIPAEWVFDGHRVAPSPSGTAPSPSAPPAAVPAQAAPPAPEARPAGHKPAADVESRVRVVWSDVLGESGIGPEDDFFDLGGNSLSAVNLMMGIQDEFSVSLEVSVLFEFPTLSLLADHIRELTHEEHLCGSASLLSCNCRARGRAVLSGSSSWTRSARSSSPTSWGSTTRGRWNTIFSRNTATRAPPRCSSAPRASGPARSGSATASSRCPEPSTTRYGSPSGWRRSTSCPAGGWTWGPVNRARSPNWAGSGSASRTSARSARTPSTPSRACSPRIRSPDGTPPT
jgi:phthiocerol/phenolphthiocerol synthesis type-I polyketide synthase E